MKQLADFVNQLAPMGLLDEVPGVRQSAEMFGYLDPIPGAEPNSMRLADLMPEFSEDTQRLLNLIAHGSAASEDALFNELSKRHKHCQFLAWALGAVPVEELRAEATALSARLQAWADAAEHLSKVTLDRFGPASLANLAAQAAYGEARKAETKVGLQVATDALGLDVLDYAARHFDGPPVIMVEKVLDELRPARR